MEPGWFFKSRVEGLPLWDYLYRIHLNTGGQTCRPNLMNVLKQKLSGGSFFQIFGPWSSEFTILHLRFGFYAKVHPRGWILRSVDLKLTIVFWF